MPLQSESAVHEEIKKKNSSKSDGRMEIPSLKYLSAP